MTININLNAEAQTTITFIGLLLCIFALGVIGLVSFHKQMQDGLEEGEQPDGNR